MAVKDFYIVRANNFVAGFWTLNGTVIEAAPILRSWVMGRSIEDAIATCRIRKWSVSKAIHQESDDLYGR